MKRGSWRVEMFQVGSLMKVWEPLSYSPKGKTCQVVVWSSYSHLTWEPTHLGQPSSPHQSQWCCLGLQPPHTPGKWLPLQPAVSQPLCVHTGPSWSAYPPSASSTLPSDSLKEKLSVNISVHEHTNTSCSYTCQMTTGADVLNTPCDCIGVLGPGAVQISLCLCGPVS